MSNLYAQTPVYLTVADVRDSTGKVGLQSVSDDGIKELIYKAQVEVDNFIGNYGTKFDSSQSLIFPIDDNGVSTLPTDIKIATLQIVEQLYENGDSIVPQSASGIVKSESSGDHSITYDRTGIDMDKVIPASAETILSNYRQIFLRNVK